VLKNVKDGPEAPNTKSRIPGCIRCGTCCIKGGPSFHHEDKLLIEKGIISSKYLYTIRAGELAYDNIKGKLIPASSDIIKLKGRQNSWTCIFFDQEIKGCMIYENRPVECRALKCWDTSEIEKIYSKNRLTRKDLISKVKGLWGLVEDHQSRCSYEKIRRLVALLNSDQTDGASEGILEIIQYDIHLRPLVVKRGGMGADMLDFLFGRPLVETIKTFGFRVEKSEKIFSLIPIRSLPIAHSP
jgi:Fe-S-cluster containining protein